MTFHQSPEFEEALHAAASHFNLRTIFIEKDYWVTYVLKNVAQSEHANEVVFKGGTSLSKAYNCIERFSEDIDFALVKTENTSDNQLKKKMKSVELAATDSLQYFKHENEEKKGRNRRTFYHYKKVLIDNDFSIVKDHIQLEINTFTNPVPHEYRSIESYLGQFLKRNGFNDMIVQYQLDPFAIKVLSRERTFFEKLLSLIRLSYDGPEKLKEKIRHFYDLHKLLNQKDLDVLIPNNFEIIKNAKSDDISNPIFGGDWINQPLASSPLFKDVNKIWDEISSSYKRDLSDLVWSPLPEPKEIATTLTNIKSFLHDYDNLSK